MGGASKAGTLGVLEETIEVIEKSSTPYVVIGGIATAALLRPHWGPENVDIDIMVRRAEADSLIDVFAEAGYATQKKDPAWLYKVSRPDVTVDLIFRSAGDFVLDDEVLERSRRGEVKGVGFSVPGPEDLMTMKTLATKEEATGHWFDSLRILQRHVTDWDYVVARAVKHDPERMLSLFHFARSMGVAVPSEVVRQLSELVLGTRRTSD